jgi:outer membrane protein assembly factor BamA
VADEAKFEWFPLAAYDKDIGIGAGVKGFLLNSLSQSESFDLTLFGSTKGERWVRFVFSLPDFELRHHKKYDYALDFIFDYDLMIKNSYFGVGPDSKYSDRTYYSKEPININLNLSRGFTEYFKAMLGFRYRSVHNSNIDTAIYSTPGMASLSEGTASSFSIIASVQLDLKDSKLNPKRGASLEFTLENVPVCSGTIATHNRYFAEIQYYMPIGLISAVMASRYRSEWLTGGGDLPVQFLLPLGGNNTLRGYPQDRFLDKATGLFNLELRKMIWWRFGIIAGLDAGRVWHSIDKYSFNDWRIDYVAGIRYYMETFIIRLDLGFSNESTGIYFNINHIF